MDITVMIKYFDSSEHAGNRGDSLTTPFSKGGGASAAIQFPSFPRFLRPPQVYISATRSMIFMLLLGVFVFQPKPLADSFPPLCSSNFQSVKTAIVPAPFTSTSPNGEPIGLSEGANIFDPGRPNQQEVIYKLQAAQAATADNPQNVVSSLNNALSIDPTDAEAQIYREDWKVLGSNHPHITLVVGVNFVPSFVGGSRGVLQGAFTAQKECNDYNRQDDSRTQIILMIANVGGNNPDERARSATFVANQIADQAAQDKTIVGIMGWPLSADSINVDHQLKIRGSTLPMISSSSSSDELQGMSHFFRVCPLNKEEAQMTADFLLNTKQKKKIAVLFDSTTAYGNNLKEDFVGDIPNNVIGPASFTGGDSRTLQDALTNMLAQKPDAIFFSGYTSDLVVLLKDISSVPQANNLLIVGGDALATTNSYPNPLPDMHDVYFTAFGSPNEWNGIDPKPPFFQEYRANFGTLIAPTGLPSVDVSVMLGYDALLILFHGSQQALSKHGNTITPSSLEEELKHITGANAIQGVTGRIAFDSTGNQEDQKKMIFMEHIKGTNLVIDETHGCLQKDNCGS